MSESTTAGPRPAEPATQAATIRPFEVRVPDEDLAELRRRIGATRWPEGETVDDDSQGVPLATMQALAGYWATTHDWRKVEATLNSLPQFMTEIDGLELHFLHVRSPHENALPLIVTHGWPGSIIEQLKLIGPLTDPTSHGGSEADAFHVVIPSLPGHGFSAKPTTTGWDPRRIARAWATLMGRLGYTRYVAQGGDWGAAVTQAMGIQAPQGCWASTPTWPAPPPSARQGLRDRRPPTPGLAAEEHTAYEQLRGFYAKHLAYAQIMGTRPRPSTGWPTRRSTWPPSCSTTAMGPASPAWSPRPWRGPCRAT